MGIFSRKMKRRTSPRRRLLLSYAPHARITSKERHRLSSVQAVSGYRGAAAFEAKEGSGRFGRPQKQPGADHSSWHPCAGRGAHRHLFHERIRQRPAFRRPCGQKSGSAGGRGDWNRDRGRDFIDDSPIAVAAQ